jgi:hypothetical protein
LGELYRVSGDTSFEDNWKKIHDAGPLSVGRGECEVGEDLVKIKTIVFPPDIDTVVSVVNAVDAKTAKGGTTKVNFDVPSLTKAIKKYKQDKITTYPIERVDAVCKTLCVTFNIDA